jgi:hypothetical protein
LVLFTTIPISRTEISPQNDLKARQVRVIINQKLNVTENNRYSHSGFEASIVALKHLYGFLVRLKVFSHNNTSFQIYINDINSLKKP